MPRADRQCSAQTALPEVLVAAEPRLVRARLPIGSTKTRPNHEPLQMWRGSAERRLLGWAAVHQQYVRGVCATAGARFT